MNAINLNNNLAVLPIRSWSRTLLLSGTVIVALTAIGVTILMLRSIYKKPIPKVLEAQWIVNGGIALGKKGALILLGALIASTLSMMLFFSKPNTLKVTGPTESRNINDSISWKDCFQDHTQSWTKERIAFWKNYLQLNQGVILIESVPEGIKLFTPYISNKGWGHFINVEYKASMDGRIRKMIANLKGEGVTNIIVKK